MFGESCKERKVNNKKGKKKEKNLKEKKRKMSRKGDKVEPAE